MKYWLVQHGEKSYNEHPDLIGKGMNDKRGLNEIQRIEVGDIVVYKIEDMRFRGIFKVVEKIGKWGKDSWKDVWVLRIEPVLLPKSPVDFRSIAKDLKWKVYQGITADSMNENDFERIRDFIKEHLEEPKLKVDHNAIRDRLQKIGDYEGKYTETEYRTEIGNIDVVWKRTKASIPSHAIEVQIRGNLHQALAKLQYAWEIWSSKPILVTTKDQIGDATKILRASFSRMESVARIVDWQEFTPIYEAHEKLASAKSMTKLDIFD
uniref:EVE domain-containing protein n=1 Tax=Candidatus Methanophagaceae archaeon ANME-1 ERB6 TaxID=2759912 RepID=A0A7G9YZX7_9EURY|nr:hypothetical protein DOLIJACH_00016 [Methanosarcinales archaeon ANME-1 ERB6]QNO53561.1 hypothetical protein LGBLGJPO_00025 [Methanosarcinales archaeon ANME-1 ERB6]